MEDGELSEGIFRFPDANHLVLEILTHFPDEAARIRSIMEHPAYQGDVLLIMGGLQRLKRRLEEN